MRRIFFNGAGFVALGLSMALLSACFGTSPQSRFYSLNSLSSPEPAPRTTPVGNGVIVAIGPVVIPDYLDRPEIMTRTGQNEMQVNEYRRWAEDLQSNLSRAIVENLSVLLPAERYSVIRLLPAIQTKLPIRYRVMVDVTRFDATPGGTVILEAEWSVYGMDKEMPVMQKSSIGQTVSGADFADMVAAMSKTIEGLSRDIAAKVTDLDKGASKN
jgi:uncharacterized protein